MHYILFIHATLDGHLNWVDSLVVVNNATVNISYEFFHEHNIFNSPGYIKLIHLICGSYIL